MRVLTAPMLPDAHEKLKLACDRSKAGREAE